MIHLQDTPIRLRTIRSKCMHIVYIVVLLCSIEGYAQSSIDLRLVQVGQQVKAWDTEINLDTIDQEKLPQRVTGGVLLHANISNFIISQADDIFSSYMQIGGSIGGMLDFTVTKHFAIQGRLMLTAEQNRFEDADNANRLWSFGIDIPVLFLARFGNLQTGYLSVGGGPFTHFTYASNVGTYTHTESQHLALPPSGEPDTKMSLYPDVTTFYSLHDNHSGVALSASYEFPNGIQIVANYLVSLTDIVTFYKQASTSGKANPTGIYPQRVELGVAYRWRTTNKHSVNNQ